METEYCDVCGRTCDGVHGGKKYNKEKKLKI